MLWDALPWKALDADKALMLWALSRHKVTFLVRQLITQQDCLYIFRRDDRRRDVLVTILLEKLKIFVFVHSEIMGTAQIVTKGHS